MLHASVILALLVRQQICVFVQLHREVRKRKLPLVHDLLDLKLLLVLGQIVSCPDVVHPLPQSLVRCAVSHLLCKRPQLLDGVRVADHAGRALHVLVKALHRVIRRVEADALQRIPEVGDSRLECVRQAADGRRQCRHLRVNAERLSHQPQNAVRRPRLKVREIALPVVDRLIAVADAHVVHLLK